MKKYLFIIIAAVCFGNFLGCAVKRGVQDNVFYSTNMPKIKIKIDPELKYLGNYKNRAYTKYDHPNSVLKQGTYATSDSYVFGNGDSHTMNKGVLIMIKTLGIDEGYWLPDLYFYEKNILDSGYMKIEGERYQYIVKTYPRIGKEAEEIIMDKGFNIPTCLLMHGLGRRAGANDSTRIDIFYFEDINYEKRNKYQCSDWSNERFLKDDQKNYLKEFINRSGRTIQFLHSD